MFYEIVFDEILKNVKEVKPLVHNITNYVTVNDCANIILACGASPIMADDILEVEEITALCNALVINIGTLQDRTIDSMIAAGKKANELNHPVILDPVGAGASKFRLETVVRLIREVKFSVIRGNISEIMTLYSGSGSTMGVDADVSDRVREDNLEEAITLAKELSGLTGAVIVITGEIDIVAKDRKAYIIRNGNSMMSKITGTGCMLTAVIGTFCAANPRNCLKATITGVCAMGLCGEIAFDKTVKSNGGTSSFKMHLVDAMSNINIEILNAGAKMEER